MGRRPAAVPRDVDIRIPLALDDLERLRAAADKIGVPLATWARGVLLRQAQRVTADLAEDLSLPPALDATQRAAAEVDKRIDALLRKVPRLTDSAIANKLNLTAQVVRERRRAIGIEGVEPGVALRTGWEDRLRAAHAEGLTNEQLAERLGYGVRTVQTKLSALGLRQNKP